MKKLLVKKACLKFIGVQLVIIAVVGGVALGQSPAHSGCIIAGNENAPVTIQEFADFDCKYCVQGHNTLTEILKTYPDKVKLVFRNMPLSVHGTTAVLAAKAFSALCLQSPIVAGTFQSELFDHQDQFLKEGETYLYKVAESIGADVALMKSDMNGDAVALSLTQDQDLVKALGFTGTPSFLIGNIPVTGSRPYTEIKAIVDKQLGR